MKIESLLLKLILIVFCLVHQSKNNILRTPYFNYPIMPNNITYYNFPPIIYEGTFWRFSFETTYVCFNYPASKTEGIPQALFVDNIETVVSQRFSVPLATAALKVTVFYRMPFTHINGIVRISIDTITLMNLTFRATLQNQILNKTNFLINRRIQRTLIIRGNNFSPVLNWTANRTGFQILSVYVEVANESDYLEDKRKKKKERRKESFRKKRGKLTETLNSVEASTSLTQTLN